MLQTLKSMLIIMGLTALASGATGAYFSKTANVDGNTFTAGTLDISIEANPGSNNDVPAQISNWMPGETREIVFNVRNNSTAPVNLAGKVSGEWSNSLGDNYVKIVGASYWTGSGWAPMEPSSTGPGAYYEDLGGSTLKILPAGGIMSFKLDVQFDINATDDYQGQVYTASLDVAAVQVGGSFPSGY